MDNGRRPFFCHSDMRIVIMPIRPTPLAAAVAASFSVHAQQGPATLAKQGKAAGDGKIQQVEVKGAADAYDLRRDDTASKIVVNRDEIAKYGDTSVFDVLKRVPGVTVSGAVEIRPEAATARGHGEPAGAGLRQRKQLRPGRQRRAIDAHGHAAVPQRARDAGNEVLTPVTPGSEPFFWQYPSRKIRGQSTFLKNSGSEHIFGQWCDSKLAGAARKRMWTPTRRKDACRRGF